MANKFLNILSNKVTINKNKLNIDTSELDLTPNTTYDVAFPNGIIKDNNNNDINDISSFKLFTGESSTGETGSTGGTSPIPTPTITTLASGRQIYRHESDEASVLIFDRYGTEVRLLIPDCKYRSNLKWGTYNTDTNVPNIYDTNYKDAYQNINRTDYIHGGNRSINNVDSVPVVTDTQLQELWPYFSTDLSAKELCDIWITYQDTITSACNPVFTGVPAVEYVRELTIPHITGNFDIPNIYNLMVIFLEQDAIDNLDKYKSDPEYQNYLLAHNSDNKRWFNNGRICTATEATYRDIWSISFQGRVADDGKCYALGVVPVRELSLGETGYTSETGSTGSTGETPTPAVIIPGATLLPSGRQIYRHESDEASVLVFDMYGTEVRLLIPDCKYRSNLKWGTYNVEATAPNFYDIYRNDANRNINYTNYIDGRSRDINVSDPVPVLTDRELQYIWPDFSTDLSAKELCDIWITYQDTADTYNNITGVPAVEYTRNLTIPGITGTFDIPNIYELMVIFLEQDAIDNLDKYKSDSQYQNYLLANNPNNIRWFNNDFNVNRRSIVSATESTYRYIWCVTAVGIVDIDYKSAQLGIVPVQELSF